MTPQMAAALIGAGVGIVCVGGIGWGMHLLSSTVVDEKMPHGQRILRYWGAAVLLIGQALVAGAAIYYSPVAKTDPIAFALGLVAAIMAGTGLLIFIRQLLEK